MAVEQICQVNKCTGCFACRNICPQDAITVGYDDFGCAHPQIDAEKCISCRLCKRVCPAENPPVFQRAQSCFAAWSSLEEDQRRSSSGGIGAVFARHVVENCGVVYGAVSEGQRVYHKRINSADDLETLRGSKYVQSDINLSYREVQTDLQNGLNVLFVGTPCQVDGLIHYLNGTHDNLITVDLICHGTPPLSYLKEHVTKVTHGKPWDIVIFRGKNDYVLTVLGHSHSILYQKGSAYDTYFKAFLDGMLFRENCYSCPYAHPERVSDITIGDFWGLDRSKINSNYKGKVSVIIPNTEAGRAFVEACRKEMALTEFSLDMALQPKQGNLLHPSVPHRDREQFLHSYPRMGFEKAVKKTSIYEEIVKNKRIQRKKKCISFYRRCIRKIVVLLLGKKFIQKIRKR